MAENVTTMILTLKVDLQCTCCYKKVKKILCQFPQIRDQIYNEKANKVTIKVVCCDPEKIRDKLCCKGCKVINSIEIVPPPKPPPPKEPEKPPPPPPPPRGCSRACCQCYGGGPCCHGCGGGYCVCGYGHMRVCHASRCDYYFTEEYPQSCSIM